MIGDIKILDKDGKLVNGKATSSMMPLSFEVETSFGGKNFKLNYTYPRDESWRDKTKTKGIVLTGN
jgi:hypothetical protein